MSLDFDPSGFTREIVGPTGKAREPDERPRGATSRPEVGAFIHGHPAGGGTAAGVNEVLLTFIGKVDKKGLVIRVQQRGYVKKGMKTEGFDGCCMEPLLRERE
jgi:hypothetical protein